MATSDLLRVTHLRVSKLFGRYTHEVPLRAEERVTIIHGPNGVGKTVLLRLVAAVLSGNLPELVKVPFESFEVTLSDGAVLGFERAPSILSQAGDENFIGKCYLRRNSKREAQLELKANQVDIIRQVSRIERELPWLSRVDKDRFLDRRFDEVLTGVELLARYSDYLPGKSRNRGFFPEADWMVDIRNRVGVHLIEAQRLLRFSPGSRER